MHPFQVVSICFALFFFPPYIGLYRVISGAAKYLRRYKEKTHSIGYMPHRWGVWLRKKDLNPHKQSQSLSCCHYTIPHYSLVPRRSTACSPAAYVIIARWFSFVKRLFKKIWTCGDFFRAFRVISFCDREHKQKNFQKALDERAVLCYNLVCAMERYRSGHNEAVLKTVWAQAHMGSNPILSE